MPEVKDKAGVTEEQTGFSNADKETKVVQLNVYNDVVNVHKTAKAAEEHTHVPEEEILAVCVSGESNRTVGGFFWKFEG